jgi:transcription termination factor Rho
MSSSTGQLERSVLEGKEREELHAIAGAIGLKGITRLKKADLVDAILGAAPNGAAHNGTKDGAKDATDDKPKRVRSTKKASDDPIADALAEEDAIAAADARAANDEPLPIRPARRKPAAESEASTTESSSTSSSGRQGSASSGEVGTPGPAAAPSARPRHDDDRQSNLGVEGNRRRRRRGRNRERGDRPYEGGEPRPNESAAEPVDVQGLVDLRDEGYGFLRSTGYLPGRNDAYVSASQVRRFGLKKGDFISGTARPAASNEKYPALLRVDEINGMTPDDARNRPRFEDLTPLFPDSKLQLELTDEPLNMTGRIVDLVSPVGKGQRGLIVSPPKAGKTTILKQIVYAIERNNPEVHLMVLLVDERPEEVTDMRRHVLRGEVVASTFDRPSEEHTHVAELTIERAKRLVELGKDVVIVLDGITRLARAYNLAQPTSGRVLSGGVDSTALYPPKKFFGAARNIEEGGSLTIVATALIDTGSRMDEVIFEEFKGTGNMELRLDRRLAERRIYPAIDVEASSTRHEELLFDRNQLQQVWKLRRVLNALEGGAGLELLIDKIKTTVSNDEFLAEIAKAPSPGG